jgi:hypothetical protein
VVRNIDVAAADWSGAKRGEHRHLWLAEHDGERRAVVSVRPLTRVEAADRLLGLASANPSLVAGLDFSFSLPAWWLAQSGIGAAVDLWTDRSRLEGWLRACEPPFWGRPGRRRPAPALGEEWRRTELAAPGHPASTFQIGGAGAVGTASLRGMPALARLQAAGFAIWPFDSWRQPAVVEVWPRLALGSLVKSSPAARAAWARSQGRRLHPAVATAVVASADALDAVAAALALAGRAGPRPTLVDPVVVLEGWIDGVPLPEGAALSRR